MADISDKGLDDLTDPIIENKSSPKRQERQWSVVMRFQPQISFGKI